MSRLLYDWQPLHTHIMYIKKIYVGDTICYLYEDGMKSIPYTSPFTFIFSLLVMSLNLVFNFNF